MWQAVEVDSTLALILTIGLALLVWAALADRRWRLRAQGAPTGAPGPDPAVSQPRYITAAELLDAASSRTEPEPDADELAGQLADPATIAFAGRLASRALANSGGDRVVLDTPWLLACGEPLSDPRELLSTLGRAAAARRALVLIAPALSEQVTELLVANSVAGMLQVAAVLTDVPTFETICHFAAAVPVTRADLQADDVPDTRYGHCGRLVLDAGQGWLISPMITPEDDPDIH